MMSADAKKYASCMDEIKQRIAGIEKKLPIVEGKILASEIDVEACALQLRFIYELIAFSSLIANKKHFLEVRKRFDKENDFTKILKTIENINPKFLPRPVLIAENNKKDAFQRIILRNEDFITRKYLAERHGVLGNILHAPNPYSPLPDYGQWADRILCWSREISNLLKLHVAVLDASNWFYVIMNTAPDGRVTVCEVQLPSMGKA